MKSLKKDFDALVMHAKSLERYLKTKNDEMLLEKAEISRLEKINNTHVQLIETLTAKHSEIVLQKEKSYCADDSFLKNELSLLQHENAQLIS